MTPPLAECIQNVAPYYNLVLVIIVVLLFLKLFHIKNERLFLAPWRLLFVAILIFIIEVAGRGGGRGINSMDKVT